jgi:hypothetical protein
MKEESIILNIYCFIRPSICNYDNQSAVEFPKGVIINYEEVEIFSLNQMECSDMVSKFNSGGYGKHHKSLYDNQDTETNVHWHLCSNIDFKTDWITLDEFIAEHNKGNFIEEVGVNNERCITMWLS